MDSYFQRLCSLRVGFSFGVGGRVGLFDPQRAWFPGLCFPCSSSRLVAGGFCPWLDDGRGVLRKRRRL